jgi:hypothetical protein
MEILALPSDWTHTDADNLSKFLDTETGKRFIPTIADRVPPLLDKGADNEILIRSGEVRGFQNVVRVIVDLAHPAPPPTSPQSEYPDLENDKAWPDGRKLGEQPDGKEL